MKRLGQTVDAVVIGSSSGGVEALLALLPALPRSMRAAVLIVLHVPREGPGLLVEVFQHKCALPVMEAEDNVPIAPGTVYFAPPDYHLLVEDGPALALSTEAPVNFSRPSVDVLFESAAHAYGSRLLGIVLTGASHDGAAGLAAVHARGGLTMVQLPADAQSASMPVAAMERIQPDFVLTLEDIAKALKTLGDEDEPDPR